jgi:ABC-type lipoprotein export system ATPase subunit
MSLLEMRGVRLGAREPALDLALDAGERVVLFGSLGSGVSLFLRIASGIAPPPSGSVLWSGSPIGGPVGYAPNRGGLFNNLTLAQNAALPALYHKRLPPREAKDRARALLSEFGRSAEADLRPPLASAAACRAAQLARAILMGPSLFVLEDPLDDMDAADARVIHRALRLIREMPGTCAIVGTTAPSPYLGWGNRFLLREEGGWRLFADKEELLRGDSQAARDFLQKE